MVLALVAAVVTGSVSTASPQFPTGSRAAETAPPGTTRVVALGDSVTSGFGCGCVPFPRTYGREIARLQGRPTSVDNLGEGGMDSVDLLERLDDRGSRFGGAVAGADIVLVTIGANDFSPDHDAVTQGDCLEDGNTECVRDELAHLRENASAILARIRRFRAGRPTAVLVTGHWNVFEGGDVAGSLYPQAGIVAPRKLPEQVNDVLRDVTMHAGDTYVDLLALFNGPASKRNVTTLLAPDGDHPNAAGHSLIACQQTSGTTDRSVPGRRRRTRCRAGQKAGGAGPPRDLSRPPRVAAERRPRERRQVAGEPPVHAGGRESGRLRP